MLKQEYYNIITLVSVGIIMDLILIVSRILNKCNVFIVEIAEEQELLGL
ncbi:MAG: hypothetical protein JO327_10515 [Nitrososphaeraceae archaeon]|nr:hypothetical protein [Nitrososphaeraceae archaeon]